MNEDRKQKQQQQMEQMQHQMARREEIFAEYPEIKKFILTKEKWLKILQLSGLIVYILRAVMTRSVTGGSVGAVVLSVIMGYGLLFIMLTACRSVSVRIVNTSAMVCVCLFVLNILNLFRSMKAIAPSVSIIEIYKSAFEMNPMFVVTDVAAFAFLFVLCIVVLWIVLPAKNRRILKEFEELSNK